jgi:hypothetical protein
LVLELGTLYFDLFLECIPFCLTSILFFAMSQNLTSVLAFDGTNYGYWKARMCFFLKSIDCWQSVETGWTKLEDTNLVLVSEKKCTAC